MRVPLSWLHDFAPVGDDVATIAATLDDLGLVVEAIERVGEGLEAVVVARVLSIDAIEGADRIRRVVVDRGDGEVQVVCGAWNFEVGDLVPLAPVGAVLPGEFAIGRRTMKGVASEGMLCSGRELQLSDDAAGIMVLGGHDAAAPGVPLMDVLGIERDTVFDLAVEANRPDAWCVAGVARDLAARMRVPFAVPEPDLGALRVADGIAPVGLEIRDPGLCPAFSAWAADGVAVGPSPSWIARRLTLAGMRPINNVVDVSNYVMLELGQPNHAYDLDRLGGGGIVVRAAEPGETLETLDGVTRTLGRPGARSDEPVADCVICDAADTVIGLAGIMGGSSTEITGGTRRVVLEAAYFDPMAIARSSKRLGLRSEASARFERGCDPAGIERASRRFFELLGATCPELAVAAAPTVVTGPVPARTEITVTTGQVNGLLGTSFDASALGALLGPLGFDHVAGSSPDELVVTAPSFRPDVRPMPFGVADVIEEVARTHGYSNLARRVPSWPAPGGLTRRQRDRRRVREACRGLGALEAWTASIVDEDGHRAIGMAGSGIEVTNPLAQDERWLRRSVLPGLLGALAANTGRRQGDLRFFEIGTVFPPPPAGSSEVDERELLAIVFAEPGDDARTAVAGWRAVAESLALGPWVLRNGPSEAAPLLGLHPTRSARIVVAGGAVEVGEVGEVDPEVLEAFGIDTAGGRRAGWCCVDLTALLDPEVVERRALETVPPSRFPSTDIDLAFAVDDAVPADAVRAAIVGAGGDLLESVRLFDVFRGGSLPAGERSLAFRLRWCAPDRTLTDAEVATLREACIRAVAEATGGTLR